MSEVDVWRIDLDAQPRDDLASLPAAELERAKRLKSPLARRRRLASRLALRRILSCYLDEDPRRIELRIGSHGKPAPADPSVALRFNLSHSGGLALLAVSRHGEVGIDVEERRGDRDFPRLAEIGLGAAQAAAVRDAPPERRAEVFYAAWVRHEAIAKCLGTGLGTPLPPRPAVTVRAIDAGGGHAAALAVASESNAMLPACQTRPPGKVARLGAGRALALLSSAAASSARTSSPR